MIVPIFRGHVDGRGHLVLEDREAWDAHVQTFHGKPVEIILRRPIVRRTLPQNRYYWKVIVSSVADQTGMSVMQAHEWFKAELLPPQTKTTPAGREVEVAGTTTELTVPEFSEYVDRAAALAAQEGVILPDIERVEVT